MFTQVGFYPNLIPSSMFVNLRLIAPFSDFTANVAEVSADGWLMSNFEKSKRSWHTPANGQIFTLHEPVSVPIHKF